MMKTGENYVSYFAQTPSIKPFCSDKTYINCVDQAFWPLKSLKMPFIKQFGYRFFLVLTLLLAHCNALKLNSDSG